MRISKYLVMATACLGLFACSNEEDLSGVDSGKVSKSIALKLDGIKTAPVTRSVGEGHSADTDVTLSNVVVAFSDGSKFVESKTFTSESEEWSDLTGPEGAGVIFHQLPNSVREVYVIGNVYSTGTTEKTEGIIPDENTEVSTWKAVVLDPKNEQDFENVTVYGHTEEFDFSGTEPEDAQQEHEGVNSLYAEANVSVAPLLSRFEIGNIKCEDQGTVYSSLKLKVIGLFDTNTKMTIGSTLAEGNETLTLANVNEPGKEGLKYTFGATDGANANVSWAWDALEGEGVSITSTPYNPETDKKFVYQFIPNKSTDGKLTQVKLYFDAKSDAAWNNTVVTASFTKKSDSQTLTEFEAGKIYTVDFSFKEENVKPWDPDQTVCINIGVEVQQWGVVALTPNFDN